MIRVVQVLEATMGGTRKYLAALVEALPRDEFDVSIVCSDRRDPTFREDILRYRNQGIRVFVLPMTRPPNPFSDARAGLRLRRHLKDHPCDLLHLHSSKAGWIGRIAARDLGCRIVYSPHSFAFQQWTGPLARRAYFLAEKLAARWTDVLLAVGAHEGRLAVERGLFPAGKVKVLPNAIDVHTLEREVALQPDVDVAQDAPVVGFLGDLRPQKDPLTFLEAARLVCERHPEATFVLPRWGPLVRPTEQAIRRHGIEDRVRLVPRSGTLMPAYKRMDMAVQSSLWEGLPYTLLEAYALSIPVIGADIPPVAELVGAVSEDLLFEPRRPDQLAERILRLLEMGGSELEGIGRRQRDLVTARHDIESWRGAIRAFYRSVASG